MRATLTVRDETTSGDSILQMQLEFETERITLRELIRSRVYQEVKEYNAKHPEFFRGLVRPTDAEQTLSGFRVKNGRHIDWQKQFQKALDAFQGNGVIILVDDHQTENLDEEITITSKTQVTFLKLVPLVGG